MVRDAQLHGRRDAQRFMDATEIIVRHTKRDRRLVTFELLTERIGGAGEAALLHPERKVLPLARKALGLP
jgi:hypothetical protein